MATQKIQLTRKTLLCQFWTPILELGDFEDERRCFSQAISHSKSKYSSLNDFSKLFSAFQKFEKSCQERKRRNRISKTKPEMAILRLESKQRKTVLT